MKHYRNRPYLLSRLAAVLIASFGGFLILAVPCFYLLSTFFGGPMDAAFAQTAKPQLGLIFCLGMFLLLFGLVARAVFHMAADVRIKNEDT